MTVYTILSTPSEKPKPIYRIRNWNDYNKALTRRGSLTLWVDQSLIDSWVNAAKTGRPGSSLKYADSAIFTLLAVGQLFHLPLRQTQGFASSVFHLLNISPPVPDYSTLSRRSCKLKVKLASKPASKIKHLLVDSSGLKVFGEGEWKVRTHGKGKRRTWRKLRISMDGESLLITAAVVGFVAQIRKSNRTGLNPPFLLNQQRSSQAFPTSSTRSSPRI
jgi:hypothetical protein